MDGASSRPDLAERRGYHHGNLREALLEAARALIAERGPAGFTLADAAKLAGVSPAAPYRHFKDRRALLAELARLGYVALGERLGRAAQAAAARGESGFTAMGDAYLDFARDEPAIYAVMFNSGLVDGGRPTHDDQALSGFLRLQEAVMRAIGTEDPAVGRTAALLVFALSHGVATFSRPGSIAAPGGVDDPNALLRIGVDAMMRGLSGGDCQKA